MKSETPIAGHLLAGAAGQRAMIWTIGRCHATAAAKIGDQK